MTGRAAIVLPNGERRVDFIRRRYAELEAEGYEGSIRGKILKELKEMGHETTYQVVFQATKPRKKKAASTESEVTNDVGADEEDYGEAELPE